MQKETLNRGIILESSLALLVLFVLLFYTYGIFVRAPYTGFRFNSTNGQILGVYISDNSTPALEVDDLLLKVGNISWQSYHESNTQAFFEDAKKGDVIDIVINRKDTEYVIPWKIPGFNQEEFNKRFFNIWWLSYIYWAIGFATQNFIRPRHMIARRLFITAFYLTSLWLIFGSISAWKLWGGAILLRAITWFLLPIYVHLHWIFPKPLSLLPKWIGYAFYAVCSALAIAELFQIPSHNLYFLGFFIAIAGSMLLLIVHFFRQPDQRREVGFLLISTFLILAPFISFIVNGVSSNIAWLTFFALPFMPLVYFYTIARRQLGGLEVRTHHLIARYTFIILIGTVLPFLFRVMMHPSLSQETEIFFTIIITLAVVLFSIWAFPIFEIFFNQRFLNIKLPYKNLQETYSNRIAISASANDLLELLESQVFPSLLIRQYAFLQTTNGQVKVLLTKNVLVDSMPVESQINQLQERSGKYISDFSSSNEWIRLILPLKAGDTLIGFWLLGRRDPDDFYSLAEIPILQSLASQTAIALSNIIHREQLLKMYQVDVERGEQERKKLSLDLHDSILNQLAFLRRNLDEASISPKFQTAYEELVNRLREIVNDLRPPMLTYGLKPAIQELADNLMERSGDKVKVKADLEASEERIPEHIEQHLFRIVQEACENSLRHASAKTITIYGSLTHEKVDLNIHDDGMGFETTSRLELENLLANRHFGLAGMIERAYLINAGMNVYSSPDTGTKIHIKWVRNSEKG